MRFGITSGALIGCRECVIRGKESAKQPRGRVSRGYQDNCGRSLM